MIRRSIAAAVVLIGLALFLTGCQEKDTSGPVKRADTEHSSGHGDCCH